MKIQLRRALAKCTRFRDRVIHAVCTPTEYFLIKNHLQSTCSKHEEWYDNYNLQKKKEDSCGQSTNYFTTTREKAELFPHDKYFSP